jgi:hypothetical protein
METVERKIEDGVAKVKLKWSNEKEQKALEVPDSNNGTAVEPAQQAAGAADGVTFLDDGGVEAKRTEPLHFGDNEEIRDAIGEARERAKISIEKELGRAVTGVKYDDKIMDDAVEVTARWSKEEEDKTLDFLNRREKTIKELSQQANPIGPQEPTMEPAQQAAQAIPETSYEKLQNEQMQIAPPETSGMQVPAPLTDEIPTAVREASDEQLAMLEPISQMGMEATVPGSIYTHDIHLEKLLPKLLSDAGPEAMKDALDKVGAISESINAKNALKEKEFAARSKDVAKNLKPKLPTPIDEGAWMKKGVEERVKNPALDALQDALLLDSGKAISSASGSMNLTGAEAPQIGEDNLFTSMERTSSAMDAHSAALATPVGQHAVPVLRSEEDSAGDVQPVHLRDITESILREKTSAQAGTGKLQSDELTRLEVVANQQVAELVEIKKGINKMVDLLTPTGGGAGVVGSSEAASKGSTKDPKNPLRASRYGLMKYLTPGDIGDRIMVNNGEVC